MSLADPRLRIGSAPDSWGVWFPDDPQQTPWQRFLDEVAEAGYEWIELGPYGYLPTDPDRLRDELGSRGLSLSAGTVFEHLHRPDSWRSTWDQVGPVAGLTSALGAEHLVVIPDLWRDPATGAVVEPSALDDEAWKRLGGAMDELTARVMGEHGVQVVFHPHADSHVDTQEHVERFIAETGDDVLLCLDTGHISYCGGDNLALIEAFPERIGYVHLKQVAPEIVRQAEEAQLGFGEAVKRGAMVEPPLGVPEMPPLLAALEALDTDLFAIVEQDLYPCDPDVPLPIAQRTRTYLTSCYLPR